MISLVGCGFLGSLLAEEIGKRWFALNDKTPIRLIDFDAFEERNAANQLCTRRDAGQFKAFVTGERLEAYGVYAHMLPDRLTKENQQELLDGSEIIVSALDNIPTRNLLWYYAKSHDIPLLTLGISQQGTGTVEWTFRAHDTYSLSPIATLGQKKKMESLANVPKELKPCELIAFRGLGLNMAVAGAKALGIYKGFDPEKVLPTDGLPGIMTTWDATNMGHSLRGIFTGEE